MPSTYYLPDASDSLEDEFSWLKNAASTFDEKPPSTFVACSPSPACNTSSGSSPPSAFFSNTHFSSDTDDSSSESDFNLDSESGGFGQFHTISRQHRASSPSVGRSTRTPSRPSPIRDQPRFAVLTAPTPLRGSIPRPQNERPRSSHPRNIQTSSDSVSFSTVKSNPWECPHCPWIQRNKRTPDLKRHIRTHTRLLLPAQWVCCGVLADDTCSSAFPAESSSYIAKPGVGGCGRTFSRRDALKRHLNNSNISCAGRLTASHVKRV